MNLNLFSLAWPVTALGPGRRVALWTAGCGRKCPGCISPEMQNPGAGRPVEVEVFAQRLLRLDPGLDGLTVSGGEPADQAEPLARVLEMTADERPHWTTILYSGYTLDELKTLGPQTARLLALTDVLIDGPYDRRIPPTGPLAGSGNQRVIGLTARGREMTRPMIEPGPSRYDLAVGKGGRGLLVGVGRADDRRAVRRGLGLKHPSSMET